VTSREIALVQATWRQVQPIAERTSEFFYGRLFALDPSLRPLFPGDLREQGKKMMATIAVAVDSLAELENLAPTVRALGRRHAGYAVEERHYATVGAALIWTFERVLGAGFTAEMAHAWSTAYDLLADLMKQGMKEEHALPARAL
jgi:hemoglobin-like flavoprotein